jgi:hypothetical protein
MVFQIFIFGVAKETQWKFLKIKISIWRLQKMRKYESNFGRNKEGRRITSGF